MVAGLRGVGELERRGGRGRAEVERARGDRLLPRRFLRFVSWPNAHLFDISAHHSRNVPLNTLLI